LAPLSGVSKSAADRIVDRNAPAMVPQQRTGGGDQRGGGQVRGQLGDQCHKGVLLPSTQLGEQSPAAAVKISPKTMRARTNQAT
jgi:hypothetical protein